MQPTFTIVIPSTANAALGLWATIQSCQSDLEGADICYNFVIVTNRGKADVDTTQTISMLEHSGKLLKHLHFDVALSPPAARQRGAAAADGELLCFFDNHCLVGKRYFERVLANFAARPEMDMLHSSTRFYMGEGTHYHYRLKLDYNFWAESSTIPERALRPYQLAAGGHGGFVVRRDVWNKVDGYGPEGLLVGYAGEELLHDLTMWRYGKNNWIDPKLVHCHFAGSRGYSRHYTDDYYTNLMVCANVIGGEKWLYKVYESFASGKHLRLRPQANMYDLMERAYTRSAKYAKEVDARSQYSLDELLVKFRTELIAYT